MTFFQKLREETNEARQEYKPPVNEWKWGKPKQILLACWIEFLAEFLGTLWLVFFGTGAAITYQIDGPDNTDVLGIAFAFAFVITSIIYAIGGLSHAHINPAVTIAVLTLKNISVFKACMYILSHLCGALAGSGLVYAILPSQIGDPVNWGNTLLAEDQPTFWSTDIWSMDPGQGYALEVIMTFFFIFCILSTSKIYKTEQGSQKRVGKFAPLAVGLSAFVCHSIGIRLTGCSINPARSFGPAVISNTWDYHYIYWAGPITGGILAALIYKYVFLFPHIDDDVNPDAPVNQPGTFWNAFHMPGMGIPTPGMHMPVPGMDKMHMPGGIPGANHMPGMDRMHMPGGVPGGGTLPGMDRGICLVGFLEEGPCLGWTRCIGLGKTRREPPEGRKFLNMAFRVFEHLTNKINIKIKKEVELQKHPKLQTKRNALDFVYPKRYLPNIRKRLKLMNLTQFSLKRPFIYILHVC